MSLANIFTRAQSGIYALPVNVEIHLSGGLPKVNIVGLAETEVKESKERVRAAIINSQLDFPARRITINLAPADLPKGGGRFDLAIAVGILAASGQIPVEPLSKYEFLGELALSGQLRAITGVIPAAMHLRENDRILVIPKANLAEARLVSGIRILAIDHLAEICGHLCGTNLLQTETFEPVDTADRQHKLDMADVQQQHLAKRGLEIAAAGSHSLLFIGPPGTGKTMLASRLISILPSMTEQEALETAAVYSISHARFDKEQWMQRPFRAPHHTASGIALVGGGSYPRPGEISLAHNGVLFLDELPEFDRRVLEVLREPIESGHITISRAARQAEFPARFQLIAAMNPCPCGYHGHPNGQCQCTSEQVQRYTNRISGPLLDRIDMHVDMPSVSLTHLYKRSTQEESSKQIAKRVQDAREIQLRRNNKPNSMLSNQELVDICKLDDPCRTLLEQASQRLGLSARAYYRILRLARTISDLEQSEHITTNILSEAISYRRLDRNTTRNMSGHEPRFHKTVRS